MRNVTCANRSCGVEYGLPDHVYQQAVFYGKERTLYCPNGHAWHYNADGVAELQRKVERLQSERDDFENSLLSAERLARYWKGMAHRRRK